MTNPSTGHISVISVSDVSLRLANPCVHAGLQTRVKDVVVALGAMAEWRAPPVASQDGPQSEPRCHHASRNSSSSTTPKWALGATACGCGQSRLAVPGCRLEAPLQVSLGLRLPEGIRPVQPRRARSRVCGEAVQSGASRPLQLTGGAGPRPGAFLWGPGPARDTPVPHTAFSRPLTVC